MKLKINRKKLRKLSPTTNPFLSLARSIIYQQISTKAGNSIYEKFSKLFGKAKPSPKKLLTFSDANFKNAGVSPQKISYLRDLALKFEDKTLSPRKFPNMSDTDIKEHLIQVKGIGSWTADMFLMFALNRPNILPVGDLAIRKGFQKAFNLRSMPSERTMRRLAKPHDGSHTELSLHLWGILDGE